MPKMKAICRAAGSGSSSLPPHYYVDFNVPVPQVDRHDILVQVKACALSEIPVAVLKALFKKNGRTSYPVGQDVAGIVKQVGSDVTTVAKGDEIVGVVPLDLGVSGCADYVVVNEFDVVKKPERVGFVDAAGCIGDALKAYTALHYLGHLSSGETVLVMDGASSFGSLVIQLAFHWGARVISTTSSEDERLYLKDLEPELGLVIDVGRDSMSDIKVACMEETGGLGVDIFIDSGAHMMMAREEPETLNERFLASALPHEIISTLAVRGRWVTSIHDLQLDPPNAQHLYFKCASVGFLFEHAWTLSSSRQGRYQHILKDIMVKVSSGAIRPNIHHTIAFEAVPEAIAHLGDIRVGKVVMTM